MMRPPKPLVLYSAILVMILLWTFNYIFGKLALREMDGFTLASFRLVIAGLLLLPIYAFCTRARRVKREDLLSLAALGCFGVLINQGCFTLGLSFTTTGHSSVIVGTAPILVLLIEHFFGMESLDKGKILGMALSFTGIVILAFEEGFRISSGTLGDLITLAGTTGFAIYAVFGKRLVREYDPVPMIAITTVCAAVLISPLAIHQALHIHPSRISLAGWAGIFYMAVMSSLVSYMIFYWALRHMPASRLAAFSYLQPVFVIAPGVFFLRERLTSHLIIGGLLVFSCVYLTERGLGERTPPPEPV
jgi:drug/metabolite transporter (DMT)-like permease